MPDTPDNSSGIPVVVAGIPTVQDEHGIVSPFPYLNPDSEDWKGGDDLGGFDTDGGMGVRTPSPDDDTDGGDEAEFEDDDEDDHSDTGFGIGIGLLSTLFMRPAPFLPV